MSSRWSDPEVSKALRLALVHIIQAWARMRARAIAAKGSKATVRRPTLSGTPSLRDARPQPGSPGRPRCAGWRASTFADGPRARTDKLGLAGER